MRKRNPLTPCRLVDGIFAPPPLHLKIDCVGLAPGDADRVDLNRRRKVDQKPLRMVLAGEVFIEIGIALPEGLRIAVVDPRVAVVVGLVERVSSAGKPIAIGDLDRTARRGLRGPVAFVAGGIAP